MRYIPDFPDAILELEKTSHWVEASMLLYERWQLEPQNIAHLLCAGLEAWYGLVAIQHENMKTMFVSKRTISTDVLQDILSDVAAYGRRYFSGHTMFNCYFGYMMMTMPHSFGDFDGAYDEWVEKGRAMIQKACELDPGNLVAKAFASNGDEYGRNSPYYRACKELWTTNTEKWGSSAVQNYFFNILWGEDFLK